MKISNRLLESIQTLITLCDAWNLLTENKYKRELILRVQSMLEGIKIAVNDIKSLEEKE